jgi:SAM-dependent methyltransferase
VAAPAQATLPWQVFGFDPEASADGRSFPTAAAHGEAPDALDELRLYDERPPDETFTIEMILDDARTDAALAEMVELFHLRGTPQERFEARFRSGTAQELTQLMARFGVGPDSHICDLGCGSGWLAYSLDRLGFTRVVAMDTSPPATEDLREVAGDRIEVIHELGEWRSIRHRFDALVSVATVHHWQHVPWVALDARRTMRPGAYWFVSMEWFADTPAEFLDAMTTHPTRQRYRLYEWAYPASAYVDLIQPVGFTLVAVLPLYYRTSGLVTVKPSTPPQIDQDELDRLVDERLQGPNGTVEFFWSEVDARRRDPQGPRLFTRPQVLVFQRTAP